MFFAKKLEKQKILAFLIILFLNLRCFLGQLSVNIANELQYTICSQSLSTNINSIYWVANNKNTNTVQTINNCIQSCPSQNFQILGLFDNTITLQRILGTPEPHYSIQLEISLVNCQGWQLNNYFSVYVDNQMVLQWNVDLLQATFILNVPHSSNSVNIMISQNFQNGALWGIKSFVAIMQTCIYDLQTKQCLCPQNYISLNGECVSCSTYPGLSINPSTSLCQEQCGDGKRITNQKECDDGNTISGDGCSSSCKIEDGWKCSGGSATSPDICQNIAPIIMTLSSQNVDNGPIITITFNKNIRIATSWEDSTQMQINGASDYKLNYPTDLQGTSFNVTITSETNILNAQFQITILKSQNIVDDISQTKIYTKVQTLKLQDFSYIPFEQRKFAENISEAAHGVSLTVIASFIPLLLSGNFFLLVNTIEITEMIFHYQFIDVRYPFNVNKFFAVFNNFELPMIPNIFEFFYDESINMHAPERLKEVKLDSFFMRNSGQAFTLFLLLVIVHTLLKMLSSKYNKINCLKKLCHELKENKFNYSFYFDVMTVTYLNLAVSSFMQFYDTNAETTILLINQILSYLTFVIVLFWPFFMAYYIYVRRDIIGDEEVQERMSSLLEGLKTDTLFKAMFQILVFCRKIYLAFIVNFMIAAPHMQMNFLGIYNIFLILLRLKYRPQKLVFQELVNIITEVLLFVMQVCIQQLRDDVNQTEYQRVQFGWVIIGCSSVIIAFHAIFLTYEVLHTIKKYVKKCKEKRAKKKVAPVKESHSTTSKQKLKQNNNLISIENLNDEIKPSIETKENLDNPPKNKDIQMNLLLQSVDDFNLFGKASLNTNRQTNDLASNTNRNLISKNTSNLDYELQSQNITQINLGSMTNRNRTRVGSTVAFSKTGSQQVIPLNDEYIDSTFNCQIQTNVNINYGKWTISTKSGFTDTFNLNKCTQMCQIQTNYQLVLGPISNSFIFERIFSIPEPHYQIKIIGQIDKCDGGLNTIDYTGDQIMLVVDGVTVITLSSNQKIESFGFVIPHSKNQMHLQIIPNIKSNQGFKLIGLQNIQITVFSNAFILASSKCICPPYYLPISNECILCNQITGMNYNSQTQQCSEKCGIGQIISSSKQCDDGNQVDGDGCSSYCAIEQNYICKKLNNQQYDTCYLSTPITFNIQEGEDFDSANPKYLIVFNRAIQDITSQLNVIFQVQVQDIQSNQYSYSWAKVSPNIYSLTLKWQTSIVNKVLQVSIEQPSLIKDSNSISILDTMHTIGIQNFYFVSSNDMDLAQILQILSRVIQVLQISTIPIFLITNKYHAVMNAVDMNQIVTYLPLINIRYPGNVKIFFNAFQDFDFNFFPNLFYYLIPSDLSSYSFSYEQFIENDIPTAYFLKNAGSNLSIWIIFLIIYCIFKIGTLPIMTHKKIRLFCINIVEKRFQWLWFIDMMWLLGMNIMISCFLQFSSITVSNALEVINIIITFACFISFFLAFPLRCYQILIRNSYLQDQVQYIHLWSGLKQNEYKSCFFHLVYYIRKMVFACTIITLYNQTQVQINMLNFFSIFTLLFLLIKNPFKKYKHNIKVFLSELLLFIAQIEMIELKNNIDSPESSRIKTGWVIVFAFLGVLILQAMFTIYQAYIAIRKWWRKLKEKDNLDKNKPLEKVKSPRITKEIEIQTSNDKANIQNDKNNEDDINYFEYGNVSRKSKFNYNNNNNKFNFNFKEQDNVEEDSNSSISLPEFERNIRKSSRQIPPPFSSRRTIFIYKNQENIDENTINV
ncbi:myxococcus cysteine-rich repeat protein (macronuclear) [Tetrahymena thermophila SB210]|uniref:Myxococcus cysteine-rich repeat protein n=1 Tax=Tetrahymena thermophila (strain SB210) TaxID=312017 RepID=Q24C13_TETTS|nr:myxococcus cysteine-rich repeat protein [Tetrahymena thermophila SB210]EAS05289.2 myxococcus cysteine-rich repeat protein [Tetrahymena thermophila SB210]|eukprot:XP_001025534.2 myxococcus cysteine-rich repeat protein [Tetrahymena thermophila SB210]